ncbi:MAG: lipoyl(octanoyl) transferase LipB, partial [Acidobacteria bacterium]|nr:lipoyl(octanoyl) transferase LipB [Acidobacteriota bacterium]
MNRRCEVRRLHLVTYENGMAMQERLVEMRKADRIDDQLLLLQHPAVITLGRAGKIENLLVEGPDLESCGVRFYETTRGGDITYHGPGQLVGYPILHLGEGRRDIRKYVWAVEEVLIHVARDFGVEAERNEAQRGVWVGDEKLAALGVRISRWTTSHGFALNVSSNLDHFRLITPCGIADKGVTSLWGFYATSPSERATRIIDRLLDLDARRIADMDATGIDIAILSLTAPGVQAFEAEEAKAMVVRAND